ncbi:hypothetical protein [Bradyrhizobium sp. Bra64]|uniref:hypothetical protein n=1 Tax=Bradyrhizobium sp. Bra64 TaxID=2926009 RepID=UPI002118194A|nr:hypothetical protein [Bradyrhizobium sp. Bra64]
MLSPQIFARRQQPTRAASLSPTVWNPADYSSTVDVISGGGLTLTASVGGSGGARSTNPLAAGSAYFEITVNTNNSNAGFSGIAKATIPPDQITNNPSNNTAGLGVYWSGPIFGVGGSGNLGAFANGNVLCVAVNLSSRLAWFRKNAGLWNNSGTADPATSTGGLSYSGMSTFTVYPFTGTGGGGDSSTLNAGASAFAQTMPSGFSSWNALNGV